MFYIIIMATIGIAIAFAVALALNVDKAIDKEL